jgi:uncharacterized protein (DUF58 family)
MNRVFHQLFFSARFFLSGSLIVVVFAISFMVHWLFPIGQVMLLLLITATIADGILLLNKGRQIEVARKVARLMSLGDPNKITLKVTNSTGVNISVVILDELPFQLQMRDFSLSASLKVGERQDFEYSIEPTCRGEYVFGDVNVFVTSPIGLISQKQRIPCAETVHVYPSIIQMKKYELKNHSSYTFSEGIKKHRRLGHSYEFDQIKEYVIGDDSRSINWKASGRKSTLMVNQYEDERSQQVYSVIDKSRSMHMPFNGLTLLDYAINSSLVISNTVLQKHDKAGLITFSDKIGAIVPAEKSAQQLRKIQEALYNEKENFLEAEYELLYHLVRNVIKNRSLIFLYTNFESIHAFERVLPILRQIRKLHLLVVMFFDNEEVVSLGKQPVKDLQGIYVQTMARQYLYEKNQIVTELSNHGIHCIKSLPSELSINTINKYLELKSRGMI